MKFDKLVYQALADRGLGNREIARYLGVNESSVRRALRGYTPASNRFELIVRPV